MARELEWSNCTPLKFPSWIPPSDPQQSRKTRTRHQKVRSGCRTCKTRRVKCDETHPDCTRCLNLNGKCGGYELSISLPSKRPNFLLVIAPKYSGLCSSPSSAIFKTSTPEQKYFHHFVNKVSKDLCGLFNAGIWTQIVLQACHINPSIAHGVVAISALSFLHSTKHDSFSDCCLGVQPTDGISPEERFALAQYATSVQKIRTAAARGDMDLQTILIASIVIICFENLYRDDKRANAQIKAALNLMFARKATSHSSLPKPGDLDGSLISAFIRLDVQAMTSKDTRSKELHCRMMRYEQETIDTMPSRFISAMQAKNYQLVILSRTMHFLATLQGDERGSLTRGWFKPCDEDHRPQAEEYLGVLYRWRASFETILTVPEELLSPVESLMILTLRLYFSCALLVTAFLLTRPGRNEKSPWFILRAFMPQFREVVGIAKALLEYPGNRDVHGNFIADTEIVFPLFLVGTRCPHKDVRREAIGLLLQVPWKEGLWDSILASKMAETIMELEEEAGLDGDFVFPDYTLRGLDFDVDHRAKSAIMVCYMAVPNTEELLTVEKKICW